MRWDSCQILHAWPINIYLVGKNVDMRNIFCNMSALITFSHGAAEATSPTLGGIAASGDSDMPSELDKPSRKRWSDGSSSRAGNQPGSDQRQNASDYTIRLITSLNSAQNDIANITDVDSCKDLLDCSIVSSEIYHNCEPAICKLVSYSEWMFQTSTHRNWTIIYQYCRVGATRAAALLLMQCSCAA